MFVVSYFSRVFFSFKIILLFNIIDFFLKIKTFNDKNNVHVCIGSQVCNFAFKVNLSRRVKEKMLIKAKAWVHASLGSVQKMQIYLINFRVYQIFLAISKELCLSSSLIKLKTKFSFCLLNFTINQKYLIGHRIIRFTPFSFKIVKHLTIG